MMAMGEPDLNTPEAVKDAAKTALNNNDTHYPEGTGNLYLREAISRFEAEKNGLRYSPDEIVLTIGATEGLFASLFSILNPGDEVIIPTPAFTLYESIVHLCRGVPVALPTEKNHFQISKGALAAAITPKTKAVVLTSPNNPTGCIYTKETLEGIHALRGGTVAGTHTVQFFGPDEELEITHRAASRQIFVNGALHVGGVVTFLTIDDHGLGVLAALLSGIGTALCGGVHVGGADEAGLALNGNIGVNAQNGDTLVNGGLQSGGGGGSIVGGNDDCAAAGAQLLFNHAARRAGHCCTGEKEDQHLPV